ncbi:RAMP superfamily CRISPR-associated protein [Clostridium algidicarnis]|uniref:RAMP superfamily CRISPR-associated protein n=1 Tax=Clostridium algidicarnis TaxID=37659 RepID=UPI0004954D54|nr:RAMP superfamily CRISPR-associated protein [Clostridium algidicarnis]
MEKIYISIELCSETIFGSGESVPGYVDSEVLHDDNGLPYLKGKTFKGKLREEAENIVFYIKSSNKVLGKKSEEGVISLFGREGVENPNALRFSDCTMGSEIIDSIRFGISKGMFNNNEVLNSMTSVRSFTSIDDDGIARNGSLRQVRVVNKGFILKCDLNVSRKLEEEEIELLCAAVSSLRHLGTMESRGKGEVICLLFVNGENVTRQYLKSFEKKVKLNG